MRWRRQEVSHPLEQSIKSSRSEISGLTNLRVWTERPDKEGLLPQGSRNGRIQRIELMDPLLSIETTILRLCKSHYPREGEVLHREFARRIPVLGARSEAEDVELVDARGHGLGASAKTRARPCGPKGSRVCTRPLSEVLWK
jgi:hypothetical protein